MDSTPAATITNTGPMPTSPNRGNPSNTQRRGEKISATQAGADLQAIAPKYHAKGWAVISVPYRSKNPGRNGWQNERLTPKDIARQFNGRVQNLGVLLGEPSGWLIDVDLDHPLAVTLASEFLPFTTAIFGRKSNPRSHYLYQAQLETKKYKSAVYGMLVELRSTRLQTVFPPSTHEKGELIFWEPQWGDPPERQTPPAAGRHARGDSPRRLNLLRHDTRGGHCEGAQQTSVRTFPGCRAHKKAPARRHTSDRGVIRSNDIVPRVV